MQQNPNISQRRREVLREMLAVVRGRERGGERGERGREREGGRGEGKERER